MLAELIAELDAARKAYIEQPSRERMTKLVELFLKVHRLQGAY